MQQAVVAQKFGQRLMQRDRVVRIAELLSHTEPLERNGIQTGFAMKRHDEHRSARCECSVAGKRAAGRNDMRYGGEHVGQGRRLVVHTMTPEREKSAVRRYFAAEVEFDGNTQLRQCLEELIDVGYLWAEIGKDARLDR